MIRKGFFSESCFACAKQGSFFLNLRINKRLTIVNLKGKMKKKDYWCRPSGGEKMKTNKIVLQPSEWIIMEKLWESSPKTLMQLYHELKVEPGWSKSTVTTLLGRMADKKILYYEEGGKAKQYYPKVKRDDAAITETESLLERVYKGSVSMMMSTLIRNNNLSEADMEELYQILGEALENED